MSNRLSMATHQSIETLDRTGYSNREIARRLSTKPEPRPFNWMKARWAFGYEMFCCALLLRRAFRSLRGNCEEAHKKQHRATVWISNVDKSKRTTIGQFDR